MLKIVEWLHYKDNINKNLTQEFIFYHKVIISALQGRSQEKEKLKRLNV